MPWLGAELDEFGWWFGFAHFATGLYWIAIALLVDAAQFGWMVPFAVLGLSAYFALYCAGATLAVWVSRARGAGSMRPTVVVENIGRLGLQAVLVLLAAATAFFFDAVILLIFGEKQRGAAAPAPSTISRSSVAMTSNRSRSASMESIDEMRSRFNSGTCLRICFVSVQSLGAPGKSAP